MNKLHTYLMASLLAPGLAWAEPTLDGGFDLNGKISRQRYDQGDYSSARLALKPWLGYGDWLAYGELPFEGHQTSFDGNTSGVVIRRGPLGRIIRIPTSQQSTSSQKTDGIADVSIGVSYALPMIQEPWLADIAIDYKFANGDVDSGLGSGSRDLSLSASLQYQFEKFMLGASLGRTLVDAKDDNPPGMANTALSIQDYSFWNASATYNFTKTLAAGLGYSDQSAPYDQAPPQGIASFTLQWRVQPSMKLVLGYSRYAEDDQHTQPANEISLGANFSL